MATDKLKAAAVALVEAWDEEREYSGVTAGDKHKLFTRITTALQSTAAERDVEIIALQLEIARLKVKPIVDEEKQSENLDDVMNIRFTGGK